MTQKQTFNKPLGGEIRIDITQPNEVSYWARKWDVNKDELIKAVRNTGINSARSLEEQLKPLRM
jgi:hypothetical protein